MFDKILVPLDGSAFGEIALPMAHELARKSGGEIRLVTVVTPIPHTQPTEEDDAVEAERLNLARKSAELYQEEIRRRLGGMDTCVPVSGHVAVGSVVEVLTEDVQGWDGELLVLTTHGRGPMRRAWLGSVADGLVRRTPCPVLVIRPPAEGESPSVKTVLEHILVTLDGSPEAREILPYARALARLFEARLSLLRVIPPHFSLSSPLTSLSGQDHRGFAAEEQAAREALELEAEALKAEGFTVEIHTAAGAHPAEGILEFAAATDVDLVAMTTHGRGGVARLILGSVADKVVRGGNVPVFLHRAS